MEHRSLNRYVLGLAATLVIAAAWPQAGPAQRDGAVIERPVQATTVAAVASGAPLIEIEIGEPDGDGSTGPVYGASRPAPRGHGAIGRRVFDVSLSPALRGFLARPTRAPPARSG